MKALYEIANEYRHLSTQIEEGDEVTLDQIADLDQISADIEQKAINIGALIRNMEIEASAINDAIHKMEDREIKLKRKIKSLMDYLKVNLELCGKKKVSCPYYNVNIKVNPAAVKVLNPMLIPQKYYNEVMDRRLNKMLLSQDLKNGVSVEGAILEKKTRLEIG